MPTTRSQQLSGWKFFDSERVKRLTREAVRVAIFEALVEVMRDVLPGIPYRTGALHDSGVIIMDGEPQGAISFGGGRGTGKKRVFYAAIVHETEGKGKNFLKNPFDRLAEPEFVQKLETQMRLRGF